MYYSHAVGRHVILMLLELHAVCVKPCAVGFYLSLCGVLPQVVWGFLKPIVGLSLQVVWGFLKTTVVCVGFTSGCVGFLKTHCDVCVFLPEVVWGFLKPTVVCGFYIRLCGVS